MIVMLKANLLYIDKEEASFRRFDRQGAADVLLRIVVSLIIAFFAMRRSDEVFVNKTHIHSILQSHIVIKENKYVLLFMPAVKNDLLRKGHFVDL